MKSFPNKVFLVFISLIVFLNPAFGQEEDVHGDEAAAEESEAAGFSFMLGGRDIAAGETGAPVARPLPPATDEPLDISPNPYVEPAFVADQVVRLAQNPAEGTGEAGEDQPPADGTPAFEGAVLDPLDPGSIGLLSEAQAGFPPDLWLGSDPAILPGLISELPAGTGSPTVNDLVARLLLSPHTVPGGQTGAFSPDDFLYARLERLYEAGDMASLMKIFDQIGRNERSARLTRLMAETYLLDGDFETGCRLASEGQRAQGSTAFLKINAICLALQGREAEARFNLQLLQESGEMDFAFQALFEDTVIAAGAERGPAQAASGAGNDGDLRSFFARDFFLLSDLTPLHVGILKVLGRDIELSIDTEEASNLVLSALTRWPALSLETKLEIADQALARGILSESFLKELVGAYQFSAADKENAYLLDYESWGVKSDALFYSLALESFDYPEAIHNIQEGWQRARLGGRGAYMSELFYSAIADIPAEPGFVAFAPDAVRISLLSGNNDKAFEWYQMVRERAATGEAEATRMLVEMWPLMITLDEEGVIPYSPQILTLWRRSLELLAPEEQLARSLLLYEVLGILGHQVPENLKAEGMLATSGEIGVGEFIGGPSLGETILRVLGRLGREGTVNASPFTLGDALYTLSESGLGREGRLIVLEALLARGF